MDLNLVRSLVAVHEEGSFSRAAARLGVPRSTVSRAVAALEADLGMRLFHRTTRSVSATSDGTALYERVASAVAELETSLKHAPERIAEPSGTLKITSTGDLGTAVLAEAVARFTARWRGVRVDARFTDRVVDLVGEGYDLAVRVTGRSRRSSTLVSRKLGTIVVQLHASPSYLARHGTPRTIEELREHSFVSYANAPAFGPRRGAPVPRVATDDMFFAREVIRAGGGIGGLPTFLAAEDVAAGTLVRVMPRVVVQTGIVSLVRPGGAAPPPRVVAFSELVVEMLRQRPLA